MIFDISGAYLTEHDYHTTISGGKVIREYVFRTSLLGTLTIGDDNDGNFLLGETMLACIGAIGNATQCTN